jgi:ABC-type branched-subunit amino acid transport system substrate-binding protein
MNRRGVQVLVAACVAVGALVVAVPSGAGAQSASQADASANPFAPKDTFCTKTGPPATKDPIKVVQIRSQLEKYEPLGYSLPVGDVNDMFQVFTDQINACGGIRGRKVVLQNEEYDPTNPSSRDAACIAATEDDKAFVVVNANTFTGTGPICVAGDHKTPLVYVGGATDAQYVATKGRIASYGPSANGQVRLLAEDLIKSGALKGKKVAIASTDLPDQVDVVQESLIAPLKKAGVKIVTYDVLPCQGNIVCTQPIPQSVMKVAGTKPDVVIPVMTATTLPVYVNEMQKAGMKTPIYETSYNALGTDLVQSKVLEVGGAGLAKYYDGATLVSSTVAGDWRLPGFSPPPIGTMCNDVYAKNTRTGDSFEPNTDGYTKWGMVGLSCTNMRMVARAMYDAGPKLTQQTFVNALRKLPPDTIGGIGGAPVVVYIDAKTTPTTAFESAANYPCKLPAPPEDTICLIPKSTKPRTIAP